MSKAGHFSFQISFMQKKKNKKKADAVISSKFMADQ